MPVFADKVIHYVEIFAENNKTYLRSNNFTQEIESDEELNEYIRKHTISSGWFSNNFRRVEYDDGSWKFLHSDDDDYKEAAKIERIKPKDIDAGDILTDKYGNDYIYLGYFFKDGKKKFIFKSERWNNVEDYSSLNKFVDIVGHNEIYFNRERNYTEHIGRYNRDKLTLEKVI